MTEISALYRCDEKTSPESLAPGQAIAVSWTADEYFADRTAVTRSALKLLGRNGNPRLFHRRWILGEPEDANESKAKARGTNAHLWLLETEEWICRVGIPEVKRPDGADGKAKPGSTARALYDEWKRAVGIREEAMAKIPDRIDVTLDEFRSLQAMLQSVWANQAAATLLSAPGASEQTIIWREPTTEQLVKVRLDRLVEIRPAHVYGEDLGLEVGVGVVDAKTTKDHRPSGFGRDVEKYGYLTQAALYSDAVEALLGKRPTWYFVAIKNESNWGTAVYKLDEEQIQRGRSDYRAKLLELARRRFTDDWLAECERGVHHLKVPDWSHK